MAAPAGAAVVDQEPSVALHLNGSWAGAGAADAAPGAQGRVCSAWGTTSAATAASVSGNWSQQALESNGIAKGGSNASDYLANDCHTGTAADGLCGHQRCPDTG